MKALVIALLLLSFPVAAQTTDAATNVETSSTCCTVRFVDEEWGFVDGNMSYARITLEWLRSDGSVLRREQVAVTDGDSSTTADNYLTGSGVNGQPVGYVRACGETPVGETGTMERRWRRRRLQWLKDNARLSNNAITLQ